MSGVKQEAQKMIDRLPDEISWDDIIYQIYVKKKIERGMKAAQEGRVVAHEDVKRRFLTK